MLVFFEKVLMAHATAVMINVLYVSLTNFFPSLILSKTNYIDIRLTRCIGFTIVMTAIELLPSYAIILAAMSRQYEAFFYTIPVALNVLLTSFFSLRNPVWLAAYFLFARKILGLPKYNIASSALLVFLFSELAALLSDGAEYLYRPFQSLLPVYAGFTVIHIFLIIMISLGSIYLMKYIDRSNYRLKMIFEVGNRDQKHQGIRGFLSACVLWCFLVFGRILISRSGLAGNEYFFIAMVIFVVMLIVLTLRNRIKNVTLFQAQLQYDTLYKVMDDMQGIRHDMNNILQIYTGFVQMKDYEGLESFHRKLLGETVKLNDKLNFHLQLNDSPALYGLFQSMEEVAQKSQVSFIVEKIGLLMQIELPEFDLCRLLSNLIKNAIEAASLAPNPAVQITVGHHPGEAIVLKITNTANGKVHIADIFQAGYSTKPGHAGRGLLEANKILARYYGCTITPIYEEPDFTMYVHLARQKPSQVG